MKKRLVAYPYKTTPGDNTFVMPPFKTVDEVKKAWEVLKEDAKIILEKKIYSYTNNKFLKILLMAMMN